MILEPKYHAAYMRMALALAELSQCRRLKVGALLIRLTSEGVPCILAEGVNGTPVGKDNCCETDETLTQTKDAVVHAEVSVLTKMREFAIPSYQVCLSLLIALASFAPLKFYGWACVKFIITVSIVYLTGSCTSDGFGISTTALRRI